MELAIDEPPSLFLFIEYISNYFVYYTVNGVILVVLLLFSALISGSEVAFFSLSPEQIDACRKSNNKADKKIGKLLDHPKKLLATILILNNFINVAFVLLSTMIMWKAFGKTPDNLILIVFATIVTLTLMFFGEVIPKLFANQKSLKLATIMASPLQFFYKTVKPLSWLLLTYGNFIDKRFQKKGYDPSVHELHEALEITTKHEETTQEEKEILKGIVNFGTLTVKQVMKSRTEVTAFDMEMGFHELLDKINKSGYSRIPVFVETIDKLEGILYIKDLLPFVDEDEHFNWRELIRPVYFVPETKKIDGLLRNFQEKRVHMALVVDEYGGTSGLITLEDIIEEIVGEINDEFDDENESYRKIDKATYIFEGKTSLNDFCKVVGVDSSFFDDVKGESESLGGLILEINSTLPTANEKVHFDNYVFTVMAVDHKRIKKIKVKINE
ncbi:MAG: gliding motility-associated protein GldE [Cyclobacteriaceae bacterium]|nr:gliding motility-associated protein GldE [Cyclobacteriaceae bacterium]